MARAAGLLLALVGSAAGQSVGPYTAAAQADLITALPGAESSAYKNYGFSGYLDINGTAPGSKHLHYWLVESLNEPATAPIAIWTKCVFFSALASSAARPQPALVR